MHNSSKNIILAVVFLLIAQSSFSQFKLPHLQLILNANYATPTSSTFGDLNNGGIGIEAGAGIGFGSIMFMAQQVTSVSGLLQAIRLGL